MKTEIYIENRRLDVSTDIASLLTYQVDDIKDFASRNCNFSKTIVLPGTSNNNILLGNIFDVTVSNPYDTELGNVATNFNASVAAECKIFQDHIQVFKGTLRILEIVVDKGIEYEVAVFGELGGLVSAISTGKLNDLDFSAYNHGWAASGITNSWTATPGSGYYYPLIDYGGVSAAKLHYDIRAFRPAMYVREYIDKIITAAGYTWESDLLETERFKRLIIPHNQKNLTKRSNSLMNARAVSQVASSSPYLTKFQQRTGTGFIVTNDETFAYNGTVGTQIVIVYNINTQWLGFFQNEGTTLSILKNGTPIYSLHKSEISNNWSGTIQTGVAVGDTIEFEFDFNTDFGADLAIEGTFECTSLQAVEIPVVPGDGIVMNDAIPRNILQKDFLSSIVKLYNLYIHEDKFTEKKLYLTPYPDFYDLNVTGVVDWNYKLDRSKASRLKPMSEINSRFYEFKFKTDNDYYSEQYRAKYTHSYGDLNYDSAYEFAKEKTTVDLIFSSTPLVGYTGMDKIVCPMYKLSAGIEERIDTNIRILQTKNITGVTPWNITNGLVSLVSNLTNYGYAGHYDDPDAPANDIHFGVPSELFFTLVAGAINVTQFNVYWSPYMAEITDKDSKLLRAYFKLTNKDVFDLDFSKLIYLDGSYWRLNKVEDWSGEDVCVCELLKVINTVY